MKTEAKVNIRKSFAKYGEEDFDARPVTYKVPKKSNTIVGNAYMSPSPKKKMSAARSSTMNDKNTTAARTTASPLKQTRETAGFANQDNALIMDSIKQKYNVEDIAKMSVDQLQNEVVPQILQAQSPTKIAQSHSTANWGPVSSTVGSHQLVTGSVGDRASLTKNRYDTEYEVASPSKKVSFVGNANTYTTGEGMIKYAKEMRQ